MALPSGATRALGPPGPRMVVVEGGSYSVFLGLLHALPCPSSPYQAPSSFEGLKAVMPSGVGWEVGQK